MCLCGMCTSHLWQARPDLVRFLALVSTMIIPILPDESASISKDNRHRKERLENKMVCFDILFALVSQTLVQREAAPSTYKKLVKPQRIKE